MDKEKSSAREPISQDTRKVFRPRNLTTEDIKQGCITLTGGDGIETQICVAQEELRQGMDIIEEYTGSVTIYGSARLQPGSEYYEKVYNLAYRISKETGCPIISGGGPGIMEAANKGAFEAGGVSIGMPIVLPHEQKTNPYVTEEIPFYFFFTRKATLSYSSKVLIAAPGGFGTFDEIFEVITLMQTKKVSIRPIIFFGTRFWNPIIEVTKKVLLEEFGTISPEDMNLFTITDDIDEVISIVKNTTII